MDPYAYVVGGVGFGLVFGVLIVLAIIITITGKLILRYYRAKDDVIKLEQEKMAKSQQGQAK